MEECSCKNPKITTYYPGGRKCTVCGKHEQVAKPKKRIDLKAENETLRARVMELEKVAEMADDAGERITEWVNNEYLHHSPLCNMPVFTNKSCNCGLTQAHQAGKAAGKALRNKEEE